MTDRSPAGATELGYSHWGQALYGLIPALVGAGLGWALPVLLNWLLGLPWIPFRGPPSLIDSVPDQVALPVLIGLGLVAGVVSGLYALHEELSITVDDHRVRLRPAARLADAFTQHGYPWRTAGDPRAADFRLWSESAQGLPAAARAILSMRARALKAKKADDAADLRAELSNLGVAVRDEGGKQYRRLTTRPDSLDA